MPVMLQGPGRDDRILPELLNAIRSSNATRIGIVVAWVSHAGLFHIRRFLEDTASGENPTTVDIVIGNNPRMRYSTVRGLESLLQMANNPNINVRRVNSTRTFHPKMYLVQSDGDAASHLFVGSCNLSAPGLGAPNVAHNSEIVAWSNRLRTDADELEDAIEILDWLLEDNQSTPLDQAFIDAYEPHPPPTNPLARENETISEAALDRGDSESITDALDRVPDGLSIEVEEGEQISDALLSFAISHFMGICERHQNDDEHCQRIHQYQTAAGSGNYSKVLYSVPIALKFLYEAAEANAAMREISRLDNYDGRTVSEHYEVAWNAWLATFNHTEEIPTVRPTVTNSWDTMRVNFGRNLGGGGGHRGRASGHILHRIIYIIAQYMWEDIGEEE